jgi:hypothetical protein
VPVLKQSLTRSSGTDIILLKYLDWIQMKRSFLTRGLILVFILAFSLPALGGWEKNCSCINRGRGPSRAIHHLTACPSAAICETSFKPFSSGESCPCNDFSCHLSLQKGKTHFMLTYFPGAPIKGLAGPWASLALIISRDHEKAIFTPIGFLSDRGSRILRC